MSVSNFILRVHMKTEVVLGRWLCLDALLDAAMDLQDIPGEERRLPLSAWNGTEILPPDVVDLSDIETGRAVWMGSAALVNSFIQRDRVFVSSLRRLNMSDTMPPLLKIPTSRNLMTEIDTKRDFAASKMSSHRCIATPILDWFGRGNPDQVEDLIRSLPGIGAKVAHGYGIFHDVEMEILGEEKDFLCGVRSMAGNLLRPVPEPLFQALASTKAILAMETTAPPYYRADLSRRAMVPVSHQTEGVLSL